MPLARGFLGVDVFFVLSGFLITTLLLRETDRVGRVDLKRFYVRRALRICPLYFASVGLFYGATRVFSETSAFGAAPFDAAFPYLMLYAANWHIGAAHCMSHAWSLAAEEQFYLVWPPVQRFLSAPVVILLLVGALVINQAINFQLPGLVWLWFGELQAGLEILQVTFTPMLLGIALAYALHARSSYERVVHWLGDGRWPVIAMVAVIAMPIDDIQGWPRLVFHAATTSVLALVVISPDGRLGRALHSRPLARLGEVSYGVYLLHMLVVLVGAAVLARAGVQAVPGLLFGVTVGGSWFLAELSFRFFEAPFLALKNRFAASPGKQAWHALQLRELSKWDGQSEGERLITQGLAAVELDATPSLGSIDLINDRKLTASPRVDQPRVDRGGAARRNRRG